MISQNFEFIRRNLEKVSQDFKSYLLKNPVTWSNSSRCRLRRTIELIHVSRDFLGKYERHALSK